MRDVENIVEIMRCLYEIEFVGLFIYIIYSKVTLALRAILARESWLRVVYNIY